MIYDSYKFIYPPRPARMINPLHIKSYDTGEYIGQPKMNGDCCVLATNGIQTIIRNRHDEPKTRVDKSIDLAGIHKCNGWIIVAGELLDKSKNDEYGNMLKGFAIWDILVWDNNYLIDSTLEERLDLLENLWPSQRMKVDSSGILEYKHLCFTDLNGIYRVPSYTGNFDELYNDLIHTDVYEGLVLKKLNGKLDVGFREDNNSHWQVKCRKVTKIYKF